MDLIKQHNSSQVSQFHFSKKTIQILLCVSVLSFLFSHSPLLPFLLHCFNCYVSTFFVMLLGYTTDRNYIFLLCNGILVFIIKNSGLISNSSLSKDFKDNHIEINGDVQQSVTKLSEMRTVARAEAIVEVEAQATENGILVTVGDAESGFLTTQDEDEGEGEDQNDEEEGIGLLSAEELNKKCDAFIKKMREGIKIEAQRLIMV